MRLSCSLLLFLAGASAHCAGYKSAFGYRAHEAAKAKDAAAFEELMEKAATSAPAFAGDNPIRTVLTHFLDLGGDDRFLPMIEAWKKRGWVDEAQTCAIERARYRGVVARDPVEAARAADVCIFRARAAATEKDRRWELGDCLEGAPFLLETSTATLERFLAIAADNAESDPLREALLDGMTHVFLQDPDTLVTNGEPSRDKATEVSSKQLASTASRFEAILTAVKETTDPTLLARSTAFGALEIERVSESLGRSHLEARIQSHDPIDRDLVWAWVRALKAKERVGRFDTLGIFDRIKEPVDDAFWYLCTAPDPARKRLTAMAVLAKAPVPDPEALRTSTCVDKKSGAILPNIDGPFPLESTARLLTARARGADAAGLKLSVTTRVVLDQELRRIP
jgi:hypothetical protein